MNWGWTQIPLWMTPGGSSLIHNGCMVIWIIGGIQFIMLLLSQAASNFTYSPHIPLPPEFIRLLICKESFINFFSASRRGKNHLKCKWKSFKKLSSCILGQIFNHMGINVHSSLVRCHTCFPSAVMGVCIFRLGKHSSLKIQLEDNLPHSNVCS